MDQTLDPRARFFLRHQQDIEEWAGIKQDVFRLADSFFWSVEKVLRTRLATTTRLGRTSYTARSCFPVGRGRYMLVYLADVL